jgi:type IV pilus assembly protein PilP
MIQRSIFFLVLVLLTACTPKMDDLLAYTQEVKQRPQAKVEPYPEFTPQPVFVYQSNELRSPFNPNGKTALPVETVTQTNCLQPDFNRTKQPLEQFGVDALSLTGNFVTNGVRWVLFKTKSGGLHKATQGSRLGLFFGKIIAINETSVTIEELLPDGAGCWQRQETVLTIRPQAGVNNNV